MLGRKETDYSICVLRYLDYPDSYKWSKYVLFYTFRRRVNGQV
jgi:hypothetical protein